MHEQGDTNPPAFLQNTSLFPKNSLPIPFLGLRTTKQCPRAGFEVSNTSSFTLKPQSPEHSNLGCLLWPGTSFAPAQCPV